MAGPRVAGIGAGARFDRRAAHEGRDDPFRDRGYEQPVGGVVLDAIAFRAVGTPLGDGLLASRGKPIHVVGRLRRDDWNGRVRVQLEIEDAAPASA